MATMLFLFGAVGMALAAMGTYGLVSYVVKQNAHGIGIRMALGASGLAVVRQYLSRGLRLGAIGAAVGIVAALALSRLLGSMLFGVSATDVVRASTGRRAGWRGRGDDRSGMARGANGSADRAGINNG